MFHLHMPPLQDVPVFGHHRILGFVDTLKFRSSCQSGSGVFIFKLIDFLYKCWKWSWDHWRWNSYAQDYLRLSPISNPISTSSFHLFLVSKGPVKSYSAYLKRTTLWATNTLLYTRSGSPILRLNPSLLILLVLNMVSGGGEESFMGIPHGKWAQCVSIYICEIILQNRINEQYYILRSKLIQWA